MTAELIISAHAVLRFIERAEGLDVKSIARRACPAKPFKMIHQKLLIQLVESHRGHPEGFYRGEIAALLGTYREGTVETPRGAFVLCDGVVRTFLGRHVLARRSRRAAALLLAEDAHG